jgi:hypothetical protein
MEIPNFEFDNARILYSTFVNNNISWRTDIGDVQHDIMQRILHIFNTLDSRTI